ncbi:MAG: nitroreductase [Armatimonadota bacterium]|nr:nitroreductase [Armatimonadota bacterium]
MTVLEAIKTRRSIGKMRPDPVPRETLEQMLEAAVWAPNHRMTEPWRFYVLHSDTAKQRFAEIRRRVRAAGLPDSTTPEAQKALERVYQDTVNTPALIVVTSHVAADEAQREEDFAATYMAIQTLMLAATELGVGTYLRTGAVMHDQDLRDLLRLEPNRRVLGIVYAGYADGAPQKRRTPAAERTTWL